MPETGPDDPAHWMLVKGQSDPTWRSKPEVYEAGCYICEDPEFALMGLPLCKPCPDCQKEGRGTGHVPADDTVCSQCGYDVQEAWEAERAALPRATGDPAFGSGMPYGSCTVIDDDLVCGFPLREDGTCSNPRASHPADTVLNVVGEQSLGEMRSAMKQRLLHDHEQKRDDEGDQ